MAGRNVGTMNDSQPPPVSGLVADKYEVLHLIGRGGMGSVWEGRHTSLGTKVAIKFIDPEFADSKEAQTRFVTEARAAATLHSKHAIQIFDHGLTSDGRPYMVMELLTGEPLDKRIDRLGAISLQETARILGQVCRALHRAHASGIIHRDLKPENIFLVRTPDEDDEVAKVLDFGIAKIKVAPGEQGLTSSTKTGAVLGTPYYMAPEQARGLRSIDTRADIWSLGVIAYKCVTGVLPFEGESVGDLLVKICTSPPPVPSLTVPGLPAAFDTWFARALEREPERRFQTASELAEALALAAGVTVRRGPMSSQPGRAPAGLGAPTPDNQTPQPALPSAALTSAPFVTSASPPKSSKGMVATIAVMALVGGSVGVLLVLKLLGPPHDVLAPQGSAALIAPGAQASAPAAAASASLPPLPDTSSPAAPSASVAPPARPKPAVTGKVPPAPAPTRTASPRPPPPSSDPGY
jgi:eukaryotic-like serine/threonine-protein kinase